MPIYDYRCDACGHAFSAVQRYEDATLDTCPQCGARPRKLLTSPAIVFKGSGWYKTDSRRGSADAKADAKADGRSDSEAKPAASGEAGPPQGEGRAGRSDTGAAGAAAGGKAEKPDAPAGKAAAPQAKKEPAS